MIETRHGTGVRLYFAFLIAVIISNAALAIIELTSWGTSTTNGIFISSYASPRADGSWFWPQIPALAVWFLLGPLYFCWERCLFKQDDVTFDDAITGNANTSTKVWIGIVITLGFLGAGGSVLYGTISAQHHVMLHHSQLAGTAMSLCVSLVYVLFTQIWNVLSYHATELGALDVPLVSHIPLALTAQREAQNMVCLPYVTRMQIDCVQDAPDNDDVPVDGTIVANVECNVLI